MKQSILKIYDIIPKHLWFKFAQIKLFKSIRDHYLRNPDGSYKKTTVQVQKKYGEEQVEFWFNAPYKVAAKAKKYGVESAALRNSIKQIRNKTKARDLIVFDVGTNYGFLSSVWAKALCTEGGQVYSFEPLPEIIKSLKVTFEKSDLNNTITLSQLAVGETSGRAQIPLSRNSKDTLDIEMVSVDGFMKQHDIKGCDLLKIDTDGDDYAVLKGAQHAVDTYRPVVIIETNGRTEIVEFLEERNYQINDVQMVNKDQWSELPRNLLCIPD